MPMAPDLLKLTEVQAKKVYTVLCEQAGAGVDELAVASFVHEFTSDSPTSEYRFQGELGFGGKFRFPALTVDYYREDKNASRETMVAATNARLAELRAQFQSEQV